MVTTVDTEARDVWEALTEEQRERLLAGEGGFDMPDDLFEYEESCDADGEESCWFMMTKLAERVVAYAATLGRVAE